MNNNQKDFINILSEILKKFIEIQESNTKSISAMQEPIKNNSNLLKEINAHFTNGFRSDIKKHVTDEFNKTVTEIYSLNKELQALDGNIDKLCHSVDRYLNHFDRICLISQNH